MSKSKVNYANKGMDFEKIIDATNDFYSKIGLADVRKVPTPVKVLKYDKGRIIGFFTKGEWVDYVGIYQGRTVVFDAKEVSVDRFDLKNLADHQYDLLKSWYQKGADAFLLIGFKKRKEIYKLPFQVLETYWEGAKQGGRKSIPYKTFKEQCEVVPYEDGIVHYLKSAETYVPTW